MRIKADETVCQGYANCLVTSPDHFDLSDGGKVVVLNAEPASVDLPTVREAVDSCPVRALRLLEES